MTPEELKGYKRGQAKLRRRGRKLKAKKRPARKAK